MQVVLKKKKDKFIRTPLPRKVFLAFDYIILGVLLCISLFPFLNLLAVSLSSSSAAGMVTFYPIDFTTSAYKYLLDKPQFFTAFWVSIKRVLAGTSISLIVMILMAYPLSLKKNVFAGKQIYTTACIIAMFFSGGLIPTYQVITSMGLYDTIWALVLPSAMNCWSMILLLNFFRRVPSDLTEYASIEGAGHLRKLLFIIIPLSVPAIATVTLLTAISHWNAWFDGYIYMSSENQPLQTYIYNMLETLKVLQISGVADPELLAKLGDSTLRAAQVFIAMLPIMCVYPIAQKFFVKGIMLGAVKE